MTSDWDDATDPAPRKELTDAQRARLAALFKLRRMKNLSVTRKMRPPLSWTVDDDFDANGGK
jgi:hypothetical protein